MNITIKFCIFEISLGPKFHFKLTILMFWTQLVQKGYSQSKTEKVNTTIEFCIFKLVLVSKFQLKLTILMFWAKSAQKRYLYPKTEQVNTTTEFSIYIQIGLDTNFSLNWQFWFLEQISLKREVRPLLVVTILTVVNFSVRRPTDPTAFVSSPSSRRDNKLGCNLETKKWVQCDWKRTMKKQKIRNG